MIHYYCFIENGAQLNADTKVFKVAVGDNRRDQIKKTLLDCYANDTDAFFRIWDDATDYHLSQIARLKPAEKHTALLGLNVVHTDIRTLYRNIQGGTLLTLENPPSVSRNVFRLLATISPRFFFKNQSPRRESHVPAVSRKNLSQRPTREENIAAVGFALMALLYWLGSLVGCWERAVL